MYGRRRSRAVVRVHYDITHTSFFTSAHSPAPCATPVPPCRRSVSAVLPTSANASLDVAAARRKSTRTRAHPRRQTHWPHRRRKSPAHAIETHTGRAAAVKPTAPLIAPDARLPHPSIPRPQSRYLPTLSPRPHAPSPPPPDPSPRRKRRRTQGSSPPTSPSSPPCAKTGYIPTDSPTPRSPTPPRDPRAAHAAPPANPRAGMRARLRVVTWRDQAPLAPPTGPTSPPPATRLSRVPARCASPGCESRAAGRTHARPAPARSQRHRRGLARTHPDVPPLAQVPARIADPATATRPHSPAHPAPPRCVRRKSTRARASPPSTPLARAGDMRVDARDARSQRVPRALPAVKPRRPYKPLVHHTRPPPTGARQNARFYKSRAPQFYEARAPQLSRARTRATSTNKCANCGAQRAARRLGTRNAPPAPAPQDAAVFATAAVAPRRARPPRGRGQLELDRFDARANPLRARARLGSASVWGGRIESRRSRSRQLGLRVAREDARRAENGWRTWAAGCPRARRTRFVALHVRSPCARKAIYRGRAFLLARTKSVK
ncbi:hypothetical protein B0H15DRAFT_986271 [Mycena belliarum]|uniref:Uncharacterized protein n=1 Tax=Mycena belliarum TaxID=1033014 RepID=A0AAD6U1G5_9AGAR|nr:hypothetical protein B0H15DRAFT_986271 [Mycena belliae]